MDVERGRELPCINCGYDLRGLTAQHQCPECGLSVAQSFQGGAVTSGFAIASMVLGIVSFVVGVLGIVTAPLALHFARRAKQDIMAGRASPGSKGFATAGMVLAWVWLGVLLVVLGIVALAILIS